MAWPDKVKDPMVIITGDGARYTPLYVGVKKELSYNIAQFNYPGVAGTEVSKGMPMGRQFALDLAFQGEDHLDVSDAFEISANDRRPWSLLHPIFGMLVVQPLGLSIDSTGMSVTKITGTVMETITGDFPVIDQDPAVKSVLDVAFYNDVASVAFAASEPPPGVADINALRSINDSAYSKGALVVKSGVQSNEYFNLFSAANRAVINATADPLSAIQSVKSMIMYPALFADSVQSRLALLVDQFSSLITTSSSFATVGTKKIFEATGGTFIAAMIQASVTPQPLDFGNAFLVFEVINLLLSAFDQYVSILDGLQTINGGDPDSYIPDPSLGELQTSVAYAASQLFSIAVNAQQERSMILTAPSNVVLLAHRFYGMDPDDGSIDRFISSNNIGINELLQLSVGRKIVWYV